MPNDSILITHPEPQDIPVLEQLWMDVFGDPPELIEAFFDAFPPALHGWIICKGAEILSSAYLIHGNLYLSGAEMRAAAYIYAVATPEKHRGKGYGGMLMHHFGELADRRDLLLYTRPASAELFQWYSDTLRMRPATGQRQLPINAAAQAPADDPRRISPSEYGTLREKHLRDVPHIVLSDSFLALQEKYLTSEGGGYFAIGEDCCACEVHGQELIIKELLAPPQRTEVLAQAVLHHLSGRMATVPVPAHDGEPCVAYPSDTISPETNWGLLLD